MKNNKNLLIESRVWGALALVRKAKGHIEKALELAPDSEALLKIEKAISSPIDDLESLMRELDRLIPAMSLESLQADLPKKETSDESE